MSSTIWDLWRPFSGRHRNLSSAQPYHAGSASPRKGLRSTRKRRRRSSGSFRRRSPMLPGTPTPQASRWGWSGPAGISFLRGARNGGGAAPEMLDLLRHHGVDVLVLDISLPGKSGLDVLKELRAEHPKLPILILSMHPEDRFALRVLKTGAAGYVTKESAPEELVKAIRKVYQGGKYVSATLAEKLAVGI